MITDFLIFIRYIFVYVFVSFDIVYYFITGGENSLLDLKL